ncbi:MAG: DUF4397 domain-containing protein [Pseudomonadota bacterium]|nr:DUF4397 domain-containing protein [Pseudomonadota bacterium]
MSISTRHAIVFSLASLFLNGCGSSNGDAEIRVLNTSIDYSSLDLYLDNGTTKTAKITAAPYGTLTSYVGVGAASYTVEFRRNGVASALTSFAKKLSKGTHSTFVGYGNSGKFGALQIAEDQDKPDSSFTKVELLDAAPDAGNVDVYLTDPAVALSDSSPTFSNVAGGTIASAGFVTVASGTYRLRVTAVGSQTDIRLDSVTGITFSSKEILSIVVTGSSGGVLVNAAVIPQQGTQSAINTSYSRVRGAAGIPAGSNVSASLGGTTLLAAAAANTVSQYTLVPSGAQTLNLTLNGAAVTPTSQTLTAGADYTVLVLNGSGVSGTTATLIADDNRLPSTSTYAKIKLVNAMSALGDPLTLNVNYTPVASAIALASASSSTEVTAGTNTEIDTVDATTSTTLFTNTSATLTGSGVYSLFMFGNAGSTVGALRTNR